MLVKLDHETQTFGVKRIDVSPLDEGCQIETTTQALP